MEKILQPYEIRHDDLIGTISVNIDESFNAFGSALAGYDENRFEAIALRVFIEKNPIITLYALDKERAKRPGADGKLPVHKFKIEMSFDDFFLRFKQFDFTVSSGNYNIEDMEVINK